MNSGNVKAYVLEYQRYDPRNGRSGMVTYREVAERDGDAVAYSTYLENGLYAWDADKGAEWEEGYGFIPMVVLQHNDVGLDFGWSELYPGLSKFREVDDQASKLNDQIRKLVEGAWLMAGVTKAKTTPTATGTEATDEKPQPGREEMKIFMRPIRTRKRTRLFPRLILLMCRQISKTTSRNWNAITPS